MSVLRKRSHLYASIASLVLAVGEMLLIVWALKTTDSNWSFKFTEMSDGAISLFGISLILIAIGLLASVVFGIIQILHDGHSERSYAGWLSIFVPYFVFTIFVNFTMWRRSGLTNSQFKDGVKKFNIEHIEKIIKILKQKNEFPKELNIPYSELLELRERKLLSEYEMNSFVYKILVKQLHHSGIPVIYKKQEIFELEVYK